MPKEPVKSTKLSLRNWHGYRSFSATIDVVRLAFQMLIAPWPLFALFLLGLGILGGLLPLVQIWSTTFLLNYLLVTEHKHPVFDQLLGNWLPISLFVGALIFGRIIYFDPFHEYLAAQLNERVKEKFDTLLFRKVFSLRLERFETSECYDLLKRAHLALRESIASEYLTQLQTLFTAIPRCVAILIALAYVNWFSPLLLLLGSLILIYWRMQRLQAIINVQSDQAGLERRRDYWRSLITERENAAELRLFGLGEYVIRAWRELAEKILEEVAQARRSRVGREVTISCATVALNMSVIITLLYVAKEVNLPKSGLTESGLTHGGLTVGKLIALLIAVQQYLNELLRISNRLSKLQKFFSEVRHVRTFLNLAGEEKVEGLPAPVLNNRGIEFKDVCFTYPGSAKSALTNLNLLIKPGERIAIVGENGAGKTTLTRLLLGLYAPTSGIITVEGLDLQLIAPQSWRENTGAVLQDFIRYAVSAGENIGFGRLDRLKDLAAIKEAATMSSAAEVITNLPAQYDTLLGKEFENGYDLSGGQWQKLAIARAYFRNAQLIVFDEPTAALDAFAEFAVYQQFVNLAKDKTVFLISHRLGSARLAERIIFLQEGRITEIGSHAELLKAKGPYAELYALQAEWYQEVEVS